MKAYLNTIDATFYDADGNLWRNNSPQFIIGGNERIEFILCKETPAAGTELATPDTWTRDTSYGDISGIGAILTIDSDNIHYLKAELLEELSAGAQQVPVRITSGNISAIADSGEIRLVNASGNRRSLAYTSRSINGSNVTFSIAGSVGEGYPAGAAVDVAQAPYCQAYYNGAETDFSVGRVVFDVTFDSERLRSMTDYSDASTVNVKGAEILFYSTGDGYIRKLNAYLWDTPSLSNPLGNPGVTFPLPPALQDTVSQMVDSKLGQKADTSALNAKANADDVYSKEEANALLEGKADASALNAKANAEDVYTKKDIDQMIGSVESALAEL